MNSPSLLRVEQRQYPIGGKLEDPLEALNLCTRSVEHNTDLVQLLICEFEYWHMIVLRFREKAIELLDLCDHS